MALAFGALLGLAITAGSDHPAWGFFIVPLMALFTLIATPFALFGLVALVAAVALPFVIMAAIFGVPLYLLYRLNGGRGVRSRWAHDEDDEDDEDNDLPADALLRRRYVAGEITYEQFQKDMVGWLRDRYARGKLELGQYETEIEKLLAPARHLDVKRDPALSGAPRAD